MTKDFVNIDFPKPNEKVSAGHYTIRVNANLGTPNIVVSIDGAEHACRHDSGFWWCDWQATPGRHTVTACKPETTVTTRMRRFQVVRNGKHTN